MRDDPMVKEMITKQLTINLFDSSDEAPNYQENWTMLKIEKAMIVKDGTIAGKPTVDLQMIDADGKQYVVLATGAIMQTLAGAIKGAAARQADTSGGET